MPHSICRDFRRRHSPLHAHCKENSPKHELGMQSLPRPMSHATLALTMSGLPAMVIWDFAHHAKMTCNKKYGGIHTQNEVLMSEKYHPLLNITKFMEIAIDKISHNILDFFSKLQRKHDNFII